MSAVLNPVSVFARCQVCGRLLTLGSVAEVVVSERAREVGWKCAEHGRPMSQWHYARTEPTPSLLAQDRLA